MQFRVSGLNSRPDKIQKRTNPVLELARLAPTAPWPESPHTYVKGSKRHSEKVDAAVQQYLAYGMPFLDQSSSFDDTDNEQMDGVEEWLDWSPHFD